MKNGTRNLQNYNKYKSKYSRFRNYCLFALIIILAMSLPSFGQDAAKMISNQQMKTAAGSYDWMQFNFDAQHSGNNTAEKRLSAENVSKLHRIFQITLDDVSDGAPVYLSGANTIAGKKDVLFVTTKAGHIYAYDAHSGNLIWAQPNISPDTCYINNGNEPCYTTSSPAIGPNGQYIYRYGLDGNVHKHKVYDGNEIINTRWPQTVTLKPWDEKGSSALSIATTPQDSTYLYVANSGYLGDRGDYQGHVTAINLATDGQNVFNANCSNQAVHFDSSKGQTDCPARRSGIWARAGVVYDKGTNRIYMATGNGPFDPLNHNWGDTVFSLNPDGTGSNGDPLDSYTPTNFMELQKFDLDLGSTAPAILPVSPENKIRHLALQSGKDGQVRLINLDNMSGQNAVGLAGGEIAEMGIPQGGPVLTQPAVWVNPKDGTTWIFIANSNGISAFKLVYSNGIPNLQIIWQDATGGTSPIIANSVLFYAFNYTVRALDPENGKELWRNSDIGAIHWQSPIVANGVLYITDGDSQLSAFALPGE